MKKTIIFLMLCGWAISSYSQEVLIDSINLNEFKGFNTAGAMGETLIVPYFSTNKKSNKNFIIKTINTTDYQFEEKGRLEIPESYNLLSSSGSGEELLLAFYDNDSKDNILMAVRDGNIIKKKDYKASGSTIRTFSSERPGEFLIMEISKNGGYTISKLNSEFEDILNSKYNPPSGSTWKLVSVKSSMEGLRIIRKQTSKDGKFTFSLISIEGDSLKERTNNKLIINDAPAYPTFISEHEGIGMSGGYYFRNGVDKTDKPDGIYFTLLTPEGVIEQSMDVPYSQVIEDLKSPLGDKLSQKNTGIILTGATMSHDLQRYVLAGEVFTRADNTGGGGVYKTRDLIVLAFSLEGKYLGAEHIPVAEKEASIKGDISSLSNLDLAVWMNRSGFKTFQHFFMAPMFPGLVYLNYNQDKPTNFCFQQVGSLKKELHKECPDAPRTDGVINFKYTYTPSLAPNYSISPIYLPETGDMMNPEAMTMVRVTDGHLVFLNIPVPQQDVFMNEESEKLMMEIMEESEDHGEDHQEEEAVEEEPPQEEEE